MAEYKHEHACLMARASPAPFPDTRYVVSHNDFIIGHQLHNPCVRAAALKSSKCLIGHMNYRAHLGPTFTTQIPGAQLVLTIIATRMHRKNV